MNVSVTKEDIDNGETMFCDACPIALALKRVFPTSKDIQVESESEIYIDGVVYSAPENDMPKVKSFIGWFDKEFKVEPIEFIINQKTVGFEKGIKA